MSLYRSTCGIILLAFLCSVIRKAATTKEIDCSKPQNGELKIVLKETDLQEFPVLQINNAEANLRWVMTYNGSESEYLTSFFTIVQGQNKTRILQLTKAIDLELLQVEHPPSIKLPDFSEENLIFQIHLNCYPDNRHVNERILDISVKSVNEFSPYFLGAPFSVSLSEESTIGTEVYNLRSKAVDLDAGTSRLTFNITPYIITEFDGRRWVEMDANENGRIFLTEPIDFESLKVRERAYFFLNVTVTDEGGYTTSTSIQVNVEDVNDQGIEFVYPNCTSPCLDVNYTVYTNETYVGVLDVLPVDVLCADLDTLNSEIEYLLITDDTKYFSIDRKTGMLSKVGVLYNDTYGYNITLLIEAREIETASHNVYAEVTVFINERKPHQAGVDFKVSDCSKKTQKEKNVYSIKGRERELKWHRSLYMEDFEL